MFFIIMNILKFLFIFNLTRIHIDQGVRMSVKKYSFLIKWTPCDLCRGSAIAQDDHNRRHRSQNVHQREVEKVNKMYFLKKVTRGRGGLRDVFFFLCCNSELSTFWIAITYYSNCITSLGKAFMKIYIYFPASQVFIV